MSKLKCQRSFELWISNNSSISWILGYEKKTSQKRQKIYQEGESSDSPAGFGLKGTRKINFRITPKNFKTI